MAMGVTEGPGGGHRSRAGRPAGDWAAELLWESFWMLSAALSLRSVAWRGSRCTLNLPTGQTEAPVETDFNFYLLKTGCLFY